MKKILIVVSFLVVAGTAFAQTQGTTAPPTYPFKVSVGALVGVEFNPTFIKYQIVSPLSGYTTEGLDTVAYGSFNFGAFLDVTFGLLSIKYATQLGKTTFDDGSSVDQKRSDLEILLAGKLPIPVSSTLTWYPLVGLELDVNLDIAGKSKATDQAKADLNDLLFDLGLGADIYLSPKFFIRPQGTFGWNLTRKPRAAASDDTWTGLRFDFSVGFGLVVHEEPLQSAKS